MFPYILDGSNNADRIVTVDLSSQYPVSKMLQFFSLHHLVVRADHLVDHDRADEQAARHEVFGGSSRPSTGDQQVEHEGKQRVANNDSVHLEAFDFGP